MRLLFDTHTFIWFITDHPRLSSTAKALIESSDNDIRISIVSLWEMALKIGLGKLSLDATFEDLIPQQLFENDITTLPIEIPHLYQLKQLPFHHRDPFDRLLIAQAISDDLPIISRDPKFDAYPVQRLWG